jgi:hypothetical protein
MIDPAYLLTEDIIRDEYSMAKWCHDKIQDALERSLDGYVRTAFPSEDELVEKWKANYPHHRTRKGL